MKTSVEIRELTDWNLVKELALFTEGKEPKTPPTPEWKEKMLKAEHSPIYSKFYLIKMYNVPCYVQNHLIRHNIGVTWYVSSSRPDRNSKVAQDRHEQKKDDPCNVACVANAEALINISRKRLCSKSELATRNIWRLVKEEMIKIDNDMAMAMVPNCIYRNCCPEINSCKKDK